MGGQACVLYGGVEFSRDTDLAVLCEPANLARLQAALDDLAAVPIAVPPFEAAYLERGHAAHFRCRHPEADGLRVDVMAVMRGVAPFLELWERRTSLEMEDGATYELLSLPDLVQAKKTQRDKDWPMLRRLLEAHYFEHCDAPNAAQLDFWFRELRTPALLMELAAAHPAEFMQWQAQREVLAALAVAQCEAASPQDIEPALEAALQAETQHERELDRAYWQPLKAELEALRRMRRG